MQQQGLESPTTGLHACFEVGFAALDDIWHVQLEAMMQSRSAGGVAERMPVAGSAAAATAGSSSGTAQGGMTTPVGRTGPAAAMMTLRIRPYVLRLMLEVMVLKCKARERAAGRWRGLHKSLSMMIVAASNCSLHDRASFIADRGGFLMEVLGLVLAVVDKMPRVGDWMYDNPEKVQSDVVRFLLRCVCEEPSDTVRRMWYRASLVKGRGV
jgi:hypothetical protein